MDVLLAAEFAKSADLSRCAHAPLTLRYFVWRAEDLIRIVTLMCWCSIFAKTALTWSIADDVLENSSEGKSVIGANWVRL